MGGALGGPGGGHGRGGPGEATSAASLLGESAHTAISAAAGAIFGLLPAGVLPHQHSGTGGGRGGGGGQQQQQQGGGAAGGMMGQVKARLSAHHLGRGGAG